MGFKARATTNGKRFMFLTHGFEKPTPEVMGAWGAWFDSMADRIVDQGGFWSGGRELTADGTTDLPFGPSSLTGYLIFHADSLQAAEALARECPVVASNQLFEIMSK